MNNKLDEIYNINYYDGTIYLFVFIAIDTKKETNLISFQVYNAYSYVDISKSNNFKFDLLKIKTKTSKIFTFSFYTKNKHNYLDYNIDSNIVSFKIMDQNGIVLISYTNNSPSISLNKYVSRGKNHFFIKMELNDDSFSFNLKISTHHITVIICICVIIPSILIIAFIIVLVWNHLKISKKENEIKNSSERNNNNFKNDENNDIFNGYSPYKENGNNIKVDNTNNNNTYQAPNTINQKDEEKN